MLLTIEQLDGLMPEKEFENETLKTLQEKNTNPDKSPLWEEVVETPLILTSKKKK